MRIKKILELFALSISLAAIITIVFYLITDSTTCFLPYEPNPFIRIPEIIMGIVSIGILISMLWKK